MNKMNFQWLKRIKTLFWSDMDGMDEVDHIQMSCQKHGKSSSFVMMNSECSQCDDFQTFDWPRELEKDRHRHRNLYLQQHTHLSQILDALSAWICVFIVAFLCGVIAAMVDIGTGWMSDLKEGICPEKFWLNKEHCCWSANDSFFEEDQCNNWQTWAYKLGYKSERDYLSAYFVEGAIFISFSLLFATLAVLLLRTFAPYAVGGGIPELKTVLSGYIIKGLLGKWTLIIKAIGVILAVAAGLVLGKEGPLVHVACCIGNIIAYLFPKYGNNEAKKREILSAAAAAGVSVAFGAPIGGVLFSLEEVSYYFPLKTLWRTFFCALIASFTLTSINPFGNNHMIVFYIDYTTPWVFIELIPFALLGIIGGFLGSLFIKANIYMCKLRKTTALGKFPVTEVIVVTLITALFNFPLEYTRLDLSHLIAQLVRRCDYGDKIDLCDYKYKLGTNDEFVRIGMGDGITRAMWQLAVTFIIKFSLLIITVGMKMPAGLYIPSLAIGAIVGRMVGTAMEQLFILYPYVSIFKGECTTECITPGLYAMVGAAAMLGGVTRMTVGLVVIIFEVTGGVKYIVPIMTAVMFSKWVGDAVSKKGIFEALIILNDYPFLDIKDEFNYATVTKEVMNPKNNEPLVVLTQDGMTIKEIETLLNDYSFNGFPVVVSRQSQYLVGFVLRKDLFLELRKVKKEHGNLPNTEILFTDGLCQAANDNVAAVNSQLDFSHIVDLATVTISKQTPMETVVDMFKKIGFRQLLVTHRGYLQGIITKKDVVRHIKQQETLNH